MFVTKFALTKSSDMDTMGPVVVAALAAIRGGVAEYRDHPPPLCNELRGEGGVSASLAVSKAKVKALSTKHGCDLRHIGKHAARRHNLAKGGVDRVACHER
jgi:hypothetical protein